MKTFWKFTLAAALLLSLAACSKSAPTTPVAKPVAKVELPVAPKPVPHIPTVTLYNGLLYAEMNALYAALEQRGDRTSLLWHDKQEADTSCPEYIAGHSMGANAAIRQAIKCQARGKSPKAIILIDPGRCSVGNSPCTVPANAKYSCENFYNPEHNPMGGQEIAGKCKNTVVPGYTHLQMPSAPGIVRAVLNTVPPETK